MDKKNRAAGLRDEEYIDFLRFEYFSEESAERYDRWKEDPHSYYFEKRQMRCVSLLSELRKGERLLDVGCGTGKYLVKFAERTDYVVGVDFSRAFLKQAKIEAKRLGLNQNIDIILGDAMNLPFIESIFDEIICINTVQYAVDDSKLFAEIHRVAKNDGRSVIDGLCISELRLGYTIWNLRNLFRKMLGKKRIGLYRNYYTHISFKHSLAKKKLIPIRVIGCVIFLPLLTRDYLGVTVPSPHHIFYLFPKLYRYWEKIEEKIMDKFPLCYLGSHIMVKAKVQKR